MHRLLINACANNKNVSKAYSKSILGKRCALKAKLTKKYMKDYPPPKLEEKTIKPLWLKLPQWHPFFWDVPENENIDYVCNIGKELQKNAALTAKHWDGRTLNIFSFGFGATGVL
jgi:hypothetical protein